MATIKNEELETEQEWNEIQGRIQELEKELGRQKETLRLTEKELRLSTERSIETIARLRRREAL